MLTLTITRESINEETLDIVGQEFVSEFESDLTSALKQLNTLGHFEVDASWDRDGHVSALYLNGTDTPVNPNTGLVEQYLVTIEGHAEALTRLYKIL